MIEIAYYEHLPTGVASLALALLVATWRRWIHDWIDVLVVSVSFLVILPPVWMILLGGSNALSPENLWWAALLPAIAWCYAYSKLREMWNEDRRAPNERRRTDRPGVRGIIAFLGVFVGAALYQISIDERTVVHDYTDAGELVPATETARVSVIKEQAGSSYLPPNDRELSAEDESVDRTPVDTFNFEELLAAAESGDTYAQNEVISLFSGLTGRPWPKPQPQEIERIRRQANQGRSYAQFVLGHLFEVGQGVPADLAEAARQYRQAADQGVAAAQDSLGLMYFIGRGVPQDEAIAVSWFRKAANQGFANAQMSLGTAYLDGRGVKQNDALAAEWYRKAAIQGFPPGQYLLGEWYRVGKGVQQSNALAVEWYREAAVQGFAMAQNALGKMYYEGRGIPKNEAIAAAWFRKAADQGDAQAQGALGFMYFYGLGVPRDDKEAYLWLLLSAAAQDEYRELRNQVEERLAPADRAAVQAEALAWRPKRTQSAR